MFRDKCLDDIWRAIRGGVVNDDNFVRRRLLLCQRFQALAKQFLFIVSGHDDGDHVSFPPDRKSTRLNSSHANISYAVFCLKKKKNKPINIATHSISARES